MSVCSLTINFPFHTTSDDKIDVTVSNTTVVLDILKYCFSLQYPQPLPDQDYHKYGLLLKPENKWLYEEALLSDYLDSLSNTDTHTIARKKGYTQLFRKNICKLDFCPRHVRSFLFIFISYKVYLPCDLFETLGTAFNRVLDTLSEKHPSVNKDTKFVLYSNDSNSSILNPQAKISDIQGSIIIIQRDLPTQNSSKIFGNIFQASLSKYPPIDPKYQIPSFLSILFNLIEEKASTVGIYRISGLKTNIETIQQKIESGMDPSDLTTYLREQPPHDLTGTVKAYLRSLQEPILPIFISADIRRAFSDDTPQDKRLQLMTRIIYSLPISSRHFLRIFSEHLNKIAENENNQMTLQNHALIIGPTIMGLEKSVSPSVIADNTRLQQSVAKFILEKWKEIFSPNNGEEENDITKIKFFYWTEIDLGVSNSYFRQYLPFDDLKKVHFEHVQKGLSAQNEIIEEKINLLHDLLKKVHDNPNDQQLKDVLAEAVSQIQNL